jgi:putative flippase GtrA
MREVLFGNGLFRRFAGFSIIGLINTAIHLLVVMGLVELLGLNPVAANCIAFVAANVFSFYANSRWNYRTPMAVSRYRRFFIVSLAGLAITAGVSAVAQALGWHYLIGTAMVFVALPGLTFIAHHWWTWGD